MRDVSYSELENVFAAMRTIFAKNAVVVKKRTIRSRGGTSTSAAINVPTKYIGSDCVVVIFDSPFKEKIVDEVSTEIKTEIERESEEERIQRKYNEEQLKNENIRRNTS